ncbi:MAG TPA: hypothetical protein VKA26_01970 [Ignavibacteriaceae bacterium]|nr:hypothetical protein [Ignavibacteriaceae bacterium]
MWNKNPKVRAVEIIIILFNPVFSNSKAKYVIRIIVNEGGTKVVDIIRASFEEEIISPKIN